MRPVRELFFIIGVMCCVSLSAQQEIVHIVHLDDSLFVDTLTTITLLSGQEIYSITEPSSNKTIDSDMTYHNFLAVLAFYNNGFFDGENRGRKYFKKSN